MRSWAFALLLLATVTAFCGFMAVLPLVPLWATRGGAGELGAGSTTSAFMLTTVLTQLTMPWLLERGGYRWTFPVGALLLGLPTPLFLLTTDLAALIAISAVRGVGFGMASVAGSAIAVRLVPPGQIGRAAGYYGLAVGLPQVAILPSGVWMALNIGFGPAFWAAGLAPVAGALLAAGIGRTRGGRLGGAGAGHRRGSGAAEPRLTGVRLYAALAAPLVVMLIAAVASSAIVTFLAIPLERAPWVVSAALLGYGIAAVGGRWCAGLLNDRYGRPVLLVPGTAAAVAGMALAAAALWPAAGGAPGGGAAGALLVVCGTTLFGAGFGAVQNETVTVMFRRAGPPGYGTASAAWNIGYDAGTGAGAVSLGLVIQFLGYGPAFALAAVALAAVLPLAARGR